MTIREMIEDQMKKMGYSVLVGPECCCALPDLMPCNSPSLACQAGREEKNEDGTIDVFVGVPYPEKFGGKG